MPTSQLTRRRDEIEKILIAGPEDGKSAIGAEGGPVKLSVGQRHEIIEHRSMIT